jgi:hypothetical protein
MREAQDSFDGDAHQYRLFNTVEEAQKAVDTFKFDGIVWHYNPEDELNSPFYEGVIDGYVFTISLTDNSYGEEDWEVTECECGDFLDWLNDSEYVVDNAERPERFETIWVFAYMAKAGVLNRWSEY